MVVHPETKFPNRLTFVLKLRSDAMPDALAGRLENLITGRRLDFASARELLDAIAGEIDANAGETASE
jgi:hypothetical protein